MFIPSEFRDRIKWFHAQYGLSQTEILTLPVRRRVLLALKILGWPIPGLTIRDDDVVFHPENGPFKGPHSQIYVCHDFMAVTDPQYYKFRDFLHVKHQIHRLQSRRISVICHSNYVAEQARCVAGIERSRILTVPLGLSKRPNQFVEQKRRLPCNRPLEALFVSAYHPRKNFERLIAHVRRLNQEEGNLLRLTVAGPGVSMRLKEQNEISIRILDFVPKDEYPDLFRASDVYLNPSAAEGFGITNLEAQGHGVPVICNDIPVFHETLGDSAAYFRVEDYRSFSQQIMRLLDKPEHKVELVTAGLRNVQRPTYRENIENILIPWLYKHYGGQLASPE